MITAEQARERTKDVNTEANVKLLQQIEDDITISIKNGEFSRYIYYPISNAVSDKLKRLGYDVEYISNQKDGSYTKISW